MELVRNMHRTSFNPVPQGPVRAPNASLSQTLWIRMIHRGPQNFSEWAQQPNSLTAPPPPPSPVETPLWQGYSTARRSPEPAIPSNESPQWRHITSKMNQHRTQDWVRLHSKHSKELLNLKIADNKPRYSFQGSIKGSVEMTKGFQSIQSAKLQPTQALFRDRTRPGLAAPQLSSSCSDAAT